jgi:hypothetical protein
MASQWSDTQERVRRFFQAKQQQLKTSANLAICDHPGLTGSHREEFQRIYLREILPKRFEVGRGMVYGNFHRSKEADIVIWDAQNFPSLPMLDHSFFFAESVRVVLESKSRWSNEEFQDVLSKAQAIRDIIPTYQQGLVDQLAMVQLELAALREGREHDGFLVAKHHIGSAGVFIQGGASFTANSLTEQLIEEADDRWPDLLLLLEPGRLVVKEYLPQEGRGQLLFYELGDDALLAFTNGLLVLLMERSFQVEQPFFLVDYVFEVAEIDPVSIVDFKLMRLPSQRIPLWRH